MEINSTLPDVFLDFSRIQVSYKLETAHREYGVYLKQRVPSGYFSLLPNTPILALGLRVLDNPEVVSSFVLLVPGAHFKILATGQISSSSLAQV